MPHRIKTFPVIHGHKLREIFLNTPEDLFILDLRSPDRYIEGHIPGALSFPFSQLEQKVHSIPKNKIVVVYCQNGLKSSLAVELLKKKGIPHVFSLGSLKHWDYELIPS